jgi:hypothetical protein
VAASWGLIVGPDAVVGPTIEDSGPLAVGLEFWLAIQLMALMD